MFFKKYKDKIAELEREIGYKQMEIHALGNENGELKKQIFGERTVTGKCCACENAFEKYNGFSVTRFCKLDITCKYFKDKEK